MLSSHMAGGGPTANDADLQLSVRSVRENTHSLDGCGVVEFEVVFKFYNYEKSYASVSQETQTSSLSRHGTVFDELRKPHSTDRHGQLFPFRLDGLIPAR